MASNPLVAQGYVNRLLASISWTTLPSLNVVASFLMPGGINITLEGAGTGRLPAMVSVIPSPEPYQVAMVTVNLVKTTPLAQLYKAQYELNTMVSDCTIRPDIPVGAPGVTPYPLSNCALENVSELTFNGSTAGWQISYFGTYYINSANYP